MKAARSWSRDGGCAGSHAHRCIYSFEELGLPTRHVFENENCSNGMQPLQLLLQPYSSLDLGLGTLF